MFSLLRGPGLGNVIISPRVFSNSDNLVRLSVNQLPQLRRSDPEVLEYTSATSFARLKRLRGTNVI